MGRRTLICDREESNDGRRQQFSDRPDPVRDDSGLPGAAAAEHPGPAHGVRAPGAAISTAGGPESRRAGDRWPGRAAGTGRRPHLAGTDRSDRADAGADALDRPQLRPGRLPRWRGEGIPHHRDRVRRRAIARHCAACCPRTPIAPSSRRSPRGRPPARPRSAPFTPSTAPRSRTRSCAGRLPRSPCGSSPTRSV